MKQPVAVRREHNGHTRDSAVRRPSRRSGAAPRLALAGIVAAFAFPAAASASNVTIKSSAEGSIRIATGDEIAAGYQFTILGSHPETMVLLEEATVAITGPCSNGGTETITIPLAAGPHTDPVKSSAWLPSGPLGQDDPATYEGSVTASVCGGTGTLNASAGAVLSARVEVDRTAAPVQLRFHYRDPAGKGKENVNCERASNSPASVCGASWSGTQSVQPAELGEIT
jgi:hypothetical protein